MSENARFLIALSTFLMLLAGLEGLAGYAVSIPWSETNNKSCWRC